MKVEETRTALPHRFAHRAARYSSMEHLLAIAVPLVDEALGRNAPVVVDMPSSTERRLRQVLGGATELIRLPAPEPALRGSGQAVVTQRARELRELTDRAGRVTVIAQHDPDQAGMTASALAEAEVATNIALARLPVTMTCLYPRALDAETDAAVRWSHPLLLEGSETVRDNPELRPPAEVLASYPVPAPAPLGAADREVTFTPWQLVELRAAVTEATETSGLGRDRAEDFVLAVNEVASNAVEHGCGVALLRLWLESDRVICEIHDTGVLREPLPGLRPPHPNSPRGRGVWIARQLCDLLHAWTGRDGTHVRLQAARS